MKSYKDSKVPLHNEAAFDLAKDFLRSVLYPYNPWPAFQEDELNICDNAWDVAVDAMKVQQRAVGSLNGRQHMWERPSGPSEQIDALTYGIVSFRSILQVLKFDNTHFQCNTVAGGNQWHAGSPSRYSEAYGDCTVLVEDRRKASMSTADCHFAE
jgi:hypothetical protein